MITHRFGRFLAASGWVGRVAIGGFRFAVATLRPGRAPQWEKNREKQASKQERRSESKKQSVCKLGFSFLVSFLHLFSLV